MRRVCWIAPLVALVAGCGGGGGERAGGAHRLSAWPVPRNLLEARVARIPAAAPVVRPPSATAPSEPAPAGSVAAPDAVSSGAPTDAEVRRELAQLYGGSPEAKGGGLVRAVSLSAGLASVPPDAPTAVEAMVSAANRVAKLPYVYGGGHGRERGEGIWVDNAYDCSGSISFAFAAAGLLKRPLDSGSLMRWGRPGPGKWVTVYANAGHAWMTVGGARFDTSGLRSGGSRWTVAGRSAGGFVARHPAGL